MEEAPALLAGLKLSQSICERLFLLPRVHSSGCRFFWRLPAKRQTRRLGLIDRSIELIKRRRFAIALSSWLAAAHLSTKTRLVLRRRRLIDRSLLVAFGAQTRCRKHRVCPIGPDRGASWKLNLFPLFIPDEHTKWAASRAANSARSRRDLSSRRLRLDALVSVALSPNPNPSPNLKPLSSPAKKRESEMIQVMFARNNSIGGGGPSAVNKGARSRLGCVWQIFALAPLFIPSRRFSIDYFVHHHKRLVLMRDLARWQRHPCCRLVAVVLVANASQHSLASQQVGQRAAKMARRMRELESDRETSIHFTSRSLFKLASGSSPRRASCGSI